jgi:dihydrofolate reductase
MASDALLFGRVTYDGFAPVWPQVEGAFADKFNTMPKYVVSATLEDPEWSNTTVLRGNVIEEVVKLKAQYDGDIVVHGSPQLAQTLIEHELVDELR